MSQANTNVHFVPPSSKQGRSDIRPALFDAHLGLRRAAPWQKTLLRQDLGV